MNLLDGVVGEGIGHATRSETVICHLLTRNTGWSILATGKAEPYLRTAFRNEHAVRVDKIRGLFMKYAGNRVDWPATVIVLLRNIPSAAMMNCNKLRAQCHRCHPGTGLRRGDHRLRDHGPPLRTVERTSDHQYR